MSWFDTGGFATLAKSALKEAQKTIDKALDITEDDALKTSKGSSVSSPSSSDAQTDSFFSAWGLSSPGTPQSLSTPVSTDISPSTNAKKIPSSASLWGSFTGSFFDNPNKLDDEGESKEASLPIKQEGSKPVSLQPLPLTSFAKPLEPNEGLTLDQEVEDLQEEIKQYPEVVMRRKEVKNVANRLSVISSESDRRSTDSCEVLGSTSTPDSDPTSISTSSSAAKLRQSGSFESVEVLTSTSSVEIIGSASPLTSPGDQKYTSESSISPVAEDESAVIPEDEEDMSVEDSCTSASENTLTVTMLEHTGLHDPNIMLRSTSSLETSFSEAMSPRESASRVLIIQPSIPKVLPVHEYDIQKDHSKEDHSRQQEPTLNQQMSDEPPLEPGQMSDSGCSDVGTLVVDSSSCEEGTIMGTSEGEGSFKSTSVTTMLADAMHEPLNQPRDQSPNSSDKSDLVKIASSEQTSGDELETGTSSDIEVISSPTSNGSSVASRQSPSKFMFRPVNLGRIILGKGKGHHREPSETSSGGSDECSEVEKLMKRIAEMTEVLEARESKLIDLSRLNADLQEANSELKSQIETQRDSQELKHISDEFTQRLGALEKKFQQAIREKELLRKQLEHAKTVAAEKEEETDKDQIINELRSEGEKLSKQQLVLNNAIKKLRATEKDNTKTISILREKVASLTQELERSKKAVSAKEDMERSHIEAVHNLTKHNQQLEKEVASLKSELSSLQSSYVTAQKDLRDKDTAYKTLEARHQEERCHLQEKLKSDLSMELEATGQQVVTLQSALEDLRQQMVSAEEKHTKAESKLRAEISDLILRAETAERRAEEEAVLASQASQPLASEMRTWFENYQSAATAWEKQEAFLHATNRDLEVRVKSLLASERNAREEYENATKQAAELNQKVTSLNDTIVSFEKELLHKDDELDSLKKEKCLLIESFRKERERVQSELADAKREVISLKELLTLEKNAFEVEKRKNVSLQEQLRAPRGLESTMFELGSPRSSPTPSRTSLSESVSSVFWPQTNEDLIDSASATGRLFEGLRPANNSTFIETLQSQLKLKEGEVQQLQWELARREAERTVLSEEVAHLTTLSGEQREELSSLSLLKTQYDALLQMYGEKLEESEELKMDLQDVKEMYKTQIEELLKKEGSPPPS